MRNLEQSLESVARGLREWIVGGALPLWAGTGFNRESGRFEERLSLLGKRLPSVPVRLMVQARQVYVFGLAARRNWSADALSILEHAYAALVRDYYGRDGQGGWIFSINRDGSIADPKRDLYGQAFALLAISSYVSATGRQEALTIADETLAFLDGVLKAPHGGGYIETFPADCSPRRQNPHMHLLESMLALWASSGNSRYLARAQDLFELFAGKFFRPIPGVLGEYFDVALLPAAGPAGQIVEPGHHYEWIWLLRQFERASGHRVQPYVDALFAHASTHGYDREGMIVDEINVDGLPLRRSRRIWPITEAIRANVVEARLGRSGAAATVAALAVTLRERFLTPQVVGGWIDRLDPAGAAATDVMPASTLYHLAGAIDELERFAVSRLE